MLQIQTKTIHLMETATFTKPMPSGYAHQYLVRTPHTVFERIKLRLERKAAYKYFNQNCRVADIALKQAFPGIERARAIIQAVPTEMSLGNSLASDLIILAQMCALLRPESVFEFGTYDGLATLHFALNTPVDARITTLDLPPDDPIRKTDSDDTFYTRGITVGQHFHGQPEQSKIQQIYSNSMMFDHQPWRNKMDLIFVDGGHDYEVVKSDTEKAMEMLRPGGLLVWHDYEFTHYGVYTFLNELAAKSPLYWVAGTSFVFFRR
jgi:predicted O-methyltransferase YrrM